MTDYNKIKVAELKELLKERNISSTGLSRKQQFIEALEGEDAARIHETGGEAVTVEEVVKGEAQREAETGVEAEKVEAAVAEVEDAVNGEDLATAEKVAVEDAPAETLSAPAPTDASTTVLAADEPIPSQLATPQPASSALPEDASSDTKKRKRRSPTPPLSEETVSKRLKAADGEVPELPEDEVIADAPAALDGPADAKVQPYGSSDDVMDVEPKAVALTDVPASDEAPRPSVTVETTTSTPSIHPATRAIYIRELIRPLQPNQLRDHLVAIATPPSSAQDDSIVESFHLDTLRTHAFALFTSLSAASRARAALHNTVFPDEPTRKPLFVDFVPDDKVQDWIEKELSAGTSRRDAKRWEVIYNNDLSEVEAIFQEVPSNAPMRQPSFSQPTAAQPTPGSNAPPSNAPLGPRNAQSHSRPSQPAHISAPPAAPADLPRQSTEPSNSTFTSLDARFKSTTTKPKLYFLPQPSSLADRRLAELGRETSRDWKPEDIGRPDAQLRRYTFDDGDRLVDGGRDFGDFGVPAGARGGFRIGGGYRGEGRGRGRGRR